MVFSEQFSIYTKGHGDMSDLTERVAGIVHKSGIRAGIVHVFNVGSTGGIGTTEFEPGLMRDIPNMLDRLIPPSREYAHELAWHDGNGHSHMQHTMVGTSVTIPVQDRKLVLGRWQQIFHIECDNKSRQRPIVVTVIGE